MKTPLSELRQYWLGNDEILGGKAKPEMNNLKPILLQDKITVRVIILQVNNILAINKSAKELLCPKKII